MARPERFELPTYSSGGCRSIQLSYGRVFLVYIGAQRCAGEQANTDERRLARAPDEEASPNHTTKISKR